MNPRAFQRMMQPFEKFNGIHIEQAFDIPSSKDLPTTQKRICVKFGDLTQVGHLDLAIYHQERSLLESQRAQLLDVPEDLERLIYSYLKETITLKLQVDFTRCPFRAPKVSVVECSHPSIDIYTLVERFNCDACHDWSPALGIDKSLLILLSRILELIGYV